jgi:arabinogalactan endo-1,4-beta-galactosidase
MIRSLRVLISTFVILLLISSVVHASAEKSVGKGPLSANGNNKGVQEEFIKGVDVSTLKAIEDHGGKYYNHGKEQDVLSILKEYGVNYIRLRIWNNPVEADGYNDQEDTVEIAKRAKEMGFKFLLDFHYSDFWADPGKQIKPAAWEKLNDDELEQAVYHYTKDVITELKSENAFPEMVQIGNEIQSGMLWPNGKTWGTTLGVDYGGYDQLAKVLKAGIKGVEDSL